MRQHSYAPLSLNTRSAVNEVIAQSALNAERKIAVGRIVFYLTIIIRFLSISYTNDLAVGITIIPMSVGILFSIYILRWVRHPLANNRLYVISVSLDAFACVLALLPNALWPSDSYRGILFIPDTLGLFIVLFASGFRLSPKAALAGGLLVISGLSLILFIDGTRYGHQDLMPILSIYLAYFLGCALLVWVQIHTLQKLAYQGALAALRASFAERGLVSVLADHHDLGTLVSSATMNAERIVSSSKQLRTEGRESISQKLMDNLTQIRHLVGSVKRRALQDLTRMNKLICVDANAIVQLVVDQVTDRFPHIEFVSNILAQESWIEVAGGEPTLFRILLNVVTNACEGDGKRSAQNVRIDVDAQSEHTVRIIITDDGPGFPTHILERERHAESTKPQGTGIGLSVAKGLTEASGGFFHLSNLGDEGGAKVIVTFAGSREGSQRRSHF